MHTDKLNDQYFHCYICLQVCMSTCIIAHLIRSFGFVTWSGSQFKNTISPSPGGLCTDLLSRCLLSRNGLAVLYQPFCPKLPWPVPTGLHKHVHKLALLLISIIDLISLHDVALHIHLSYVDPVYKKSLVHMQQYVPSWWQSWVSSHLKIKEMIVHIYKNVLVDHYIQ